MAIPKIRLYHFSIGLVAGEPKTRRQLASKSTKGYTLLRLLVIQGKIYHIRPAAKVAGRGRSILVLKSKVIFDWSHSCYLFCNF